MPLHHYQCTIFGNKLFGIYSTYLFVLHKVYANLVWKCSESDSSLTVVTSDACLGIVQQTKSMSQANETRTSTNIRLLFFFFQLSPIHLISYSFDPIHLFVLNGFILMISYLIEINAKSPPQEYLLAYLSSIIPTWRPLALFVIE